MRAIRRFILFGALAALGLLAAAAVAGSFMGRVRAAAWFNSPALRVYWTVLVLLLAAGPVFFPRLRRSAGLLGVHLGCVLIVGGAMYGSAAGHALAARWLGRQKAVHGYMPLASGETGDVLLAADMTSEVGRLPFSVRLKESWVEYYDTWRLTVAMEGGETGVTVPWTVGETIEIPAARARVDVLEYIACAQSVYPEGSRDLLEITERAGRQKILVPVEMGREVVLADVTLRIKGVFSQLAAHTEDGRHYAADDGPRWNPAVAVELEDPDGTKSPPRYVYGLYPELSVAGTEGLDLRYIARQPSGAVADATSHMPAMRLAVTREGETEVGWLIVPRGHGGADLKLAGLTLRLESPPGPAKDYVSELAILEDGREGFGGGAVRVNHPLHYGGYHIYQHDYDESEGEYTILAVRSDSGLTAVYCGFALLLAGIFWHFWFGPMLAYLIRRGGRSDVR